jgi:hypothetical protein
VIYDATAYDVASSTEAVLPRTVAQNGNWCRATHIVIGLQCSAKNWSSVEHLEEVAGDERSVDE